MPAKARKTKAASRFALPEPMTEDKEKAEEFLGLRPPRVGRPRKVDPVAEIRIQYKLPLELVARAQQWGVSQSPPLVDPKKVFIALLERGLSLGPAGR